MNLLKKLTARNHPGVLVHLFSGKILAAEQPTNYAISGLITVVAHWEIAVLLRIGGVFYRSRF
jgi:hypothetical protein